LLTLRPASPLDLPPLEELLINHKHLFYDDYDAYSREFLISLVQSGELYVVDYYGLAIGAVWYHSQLDGLHLSLSFLILPSYLRKALKAGVIDAVIDIAFDVFEVEKIKALAMETQKGAIGLLKKYKFKQVAYLWNETKKNGKKIDVIGFELRKKFWKKYKAGVNQ
jgi:RimJ/RimL family protein N-acetyltransferase